METTKEIKIVVCDSCGESRPLVKCQFCGAMICQYCSVKVHYVQKDSIRGHCLAFIYDRVMCQKHLPEVTIAKDA